MNLYTSAHEVLSVLSGPDSFAPGDPSDSGTKLPSNRQMDGEAIALLLSLDYLQVSEGGEHLCLVNCDKPTLENRLALLNLASRLERVFSLPNRHAESCFFIGGEIAPRQFGLPVSDRPVMGVGGKGCSATEAFQGCIGEAAEYLALLDWGDHPRFSAKPEDVLHLLEEPKWGNETARDMLTWFLTGIGLSDNQSEGAIDWTMARTIDGVVRLPVPLDLCIRRPHPSPCAWRKAESNGCSAGRTIESAQYNAMMEVIERDAVAHWWYGQQPPSLLTIDHQADPGMADWLADLRQSSQRAHWFLELPSDTGVPVVAALSCREGGDAVIGGYAADLDPAEALRKAFLEMCQMELAHDLVELKINQRGEEAINEVDKQHLARSKQLNKHHYRQFSPEPENTVVLQSRCLGGDGQLATVLNLLHNAGFHALFLDMTRPEIGIPSVRVLVPGLQSGKVDWATARLCAAARDVGYNPKRWASLPSVI